MADPPSGTFPSVLEVLRATPELHSFNADDGTKLVYSVISNGERGGRLGPLVIAEGKGETVYRYLDFAREMQEKGYGPIFILDHRGQGFSEQVLKDSIHVKSFDTYVRDFIKFMDGPVNAELASRGILQKPAIVAHSMGGPIVNLALHQRPDLTNRVAYVAPMFEINMGTTMERLHDKPAEYYTGAMRAFGFGEKTLGGSVTSTPKKMISTDTARMQTSYAIEREMNVRTPKASVSWLNEALKAGDKVRQPGTAPSTPSIIFEGQFDTLVSNTALKDYACGAQSCTLVELPGAHALHQEKDPVRHTLEDKIDDFFQDRQIKDPEIGCENLYKVIVR